MVITNRQTAQQRVIEYFEKAGLDYYYWDRSFNMHFGYYRAGLNPFKLPDLLNQMNREVMNRLELAQHPDPLVLDLGCGLGAASRFMARTLDKGLFNGFTITPWQVEFGNQLTHEEGLDHSVRLYEADFAHLPVGSHCADAAFAIESACYARGRDKMELAEELYRVLRPGGRFVITDGFRKHSQPLPGWLEKVYRKNMDCWALKELADIQLFIKTLKKVGFRNIKVEEASWRVAPSFAHIPFVTLRYYWDIWRKKELAHLDRQRKNNALAPALGMIMGLSRRHFGYYIISGEK